MASVISGVLAIAGAALVLLAGVGVVRFPDIYSRMHAATKAPTLGIALVAAAGMIRIDGSVSRLLLATLTIFVTAPVASHLVGRSAHRAEHIEIRLEAGDDLAAMVDEDTAGD